MLKEIGALCRFALLILAIFSVILLFSCSQNSGFQDRSEMLCADISRVAVLTSSLAEIWCEAGGEVHITVGETLERGFASESAALVDSGAGKNINYEILISESPTLLICTPDIPAQKKAAEIAAERGIPVLSLRVESFMDYVCALEAMTALTGDATALSRAKNELSRQINTIKEAVELRELAECDFLFIRSGSSASSFKTKSSDEHFAAAMLCELGLFNIADEAYTATLSPESIYEKDPSYIFISLMGDREAARKNVDRILKSEPYASLSAVKEGRAVVLPEELFHFKPCEKWAQAYEYLAAVLLHDIDYDK